MSPLFESCFQEEAGSYAVYAPPGYNADRVGPVIVERI